MTHDISKGLYRGTWQPPAIKRSWERVNITNDSTQRLLAGLIDGQVVDACGWFDGDVLRVLVAHTDRGRRVTYRRNARGSSIKTERRS